MGKVLCVGAAVVDFVFYVAEMPNRAEKYGTEDAKIVGGGCAANAAVAVVKMGGEAVLAARLGDDHIGEIVLSDLATEGVDVSNVTRTKGGMSSYSSVMVDALGERQIVNFRGKNLVLETSWFDDEPGVNAVLTDTRRVDAAIAALNYAKTLGVPGIVDGEAPIDPRILHAASHIALSMQGLRQLHPDDQALHAVQKVRETYGGWVCVTDGANGVYFAGNAVTGHVPSPKVDVVDTLGAGDVWHGVFALELSNGVAEEDAILIANAAAALKCTKLGGRAGCPGRNEVQQFLDGEQTK